jgi:hypothetical protein
MVIASGLCGCVIPGTNTSVMKPAQVVPPPFEEIAPVAPSNGSDQNNRPAESAAYEEPRRELVFPDTSDLPLPHVNE